MPYVNEIRLMGHLGRDAETAFTPSGASLTSFSLATTRSYKKGEEWVKETTWHNVKIWNARNPNSFLKGDTVYVEGRQEHRKYEGKDGQPKYMSEVVADPGRAFVVKSKIMEESDGGERTEAAGSGEPTPF